jgi:hypothetical protein
MAKARKRGKAYLKETKTEEPRQIPVNDSLEALFKRIRKENNYTRAQKKSGQPAQWIDRFCE